MNEAYRGCLSIEELTYENLRKKFWEIVQENNLENQEVSVLSAHTLKPEQAIGNPERKDYPLIKGREVMVQAEVMGTKGQAFTDMPGDFKGTLAHILDFSLSDNFQRAVFIAALNGLLRHLNCIECTIHCRDKEPEDCASHLVDYVKDRFGNPKIGFVGLQPAMVDHLAQNFEIRVTDMDKENQGKEKYGITIEPVEHTQEMIEWGDVVFATGSTIVNNTYRTLFRDRPLVFYGVTVTGIAYLSGCDQYCHLGH